MTLVRNGTKKVEVNNTKSTDYRILSGTEQEDPKSSYTFNCGVAPLNHLITNSSTIYPNFKLVVFEDDNLTPQKGGKP